MEKAQKVIERVKLYKEQSQQRRSVWVECFKAYMSKIDTTKNPFLANLFIPKVHEAVELLSSYLAGPNQSITAEGEGKEDTEKAVLAAKLLSFQWTKELNAREHIIKWIKQAEIFGNGIMKVGWDYKKKVPFMQALSISDVFFDFYLSDIQDSPIIHRIVRPIKDVKNDDRYKNTDKIIPISSSDIEKDENYGSYDDSIATIANDSMCELFEQHDDRKIITVANTAQGPIVLREIEQEYSFKPFEKLRLKDHPLPNRAYDMGVVEQTLKIQFAFNDLMNEMFDNISLINNKMWLKRRGANINPMDLVRRPGQVIEVDNITNDIRSEEVSDIKQSAMQMLQILDNEFQQASMVVNLLKGIGSDSDTATGEVLQQQNVQTLLTNIEANVRASLSRLGSKILEVNFKHAKGLKSIKVFDDEEKATFMDISVQELVGKYDIRISPDRGHLDNKMVKQKQVLDFLALVQKDIAIQQKYPQLLQKIYKRWLELGGVGDAQYFFEEQVDEAGGAMISGATGAGGQARFTGLTPESQIMGGGATDIMSKVNNPML